MDGEALHTSNTRGAPWGRFDSPLDLFAAVLLLGDPGDPGLVARARSDAYADFELLYQGARAQASTLPPALLPIEGRARWHRTFAALGRLRHRQRAALTLVHVLGVEPAAAARILGIRAHELRNVLESATSALAKALGEPADVPRALRTAGARLMAQPTAPAQVPEPVHMPRSVVRALLADPPRLRPRRRRTKLALVAALAILTVAALVPAVARNAAPKPLPQVPRIAPVTQAVPAPVVAVPRVTVARGDSLWRIADRELGNARRWPEIWQLNRGRLMFARARFIDPDLIEPGWRLILPRQHDTSAVRKSAI